MPENVLDKFRRLTTGAIGRRKEYEPPDPQVISSERRSFRPKAEIRGKTAIPYDEREEFDKETGMTRVIRRPMPGQIPEGYRRGTTPAPRPASTPIAPARGIGGTVSGMAKEPGSLGGRVSAMASGRGLGATGRRPVLGSMKRGGKVKKTGLYKLHQGEKVVPLSSLRHMRG